MIPDKWCVRATNETREIINDFILEKGYNTRLTINYMVHYPFTPGGGSAWNEPEKGYTEITFEEFETYVLNKTIVSEDYAYITILLKELNIQ